MTQKFDPSIPVLTEVLDDSVVAPGAAPARSGAPAAPAPADSGAAPAASVAQRAAKEWSDADWELLERRVCQRVLAQLQNRTDFVLEQRVRDAMSEVLQHALANLTADIRAGLNETLEKIVSRAVAQELAHLKAAGQ